MEDDLAFPQQQRFSSSLTTPGTLFKVGLHQIFSFLPSTEWSYVQQVCRHWAIAGFTQPPLRSLRVNLPNAFVTHPAQAAFHRHVTALHVYRTEATPPEEEDMARPLFQVTHVARRIREVRFISGVPLSAGDIAFLVVHTPNLQLLHTGQVDMVEAAAQLLAKFAHLRRLTLSTTPLTNLAHLATNLSQCAGLMSLNHSGRGNFFQPQHWGMLGERLHRQLKELTLQGSRNCAHFLHQTGLFEGLTHLSLEQMNLSVAPVVASLGQLKRLTHLTLALEETFAPPLSRNFSHLLAPLQSVDVLPTLRRLKVHAPKVWSDRVFHWSADQSVKHATAKAAAARSPFLHGPLKGQPFRVKPPPTETTTTTTTATTTAPADGVTDVEERKEQMEVVQGLE